MSEAKEREVVPVDWVQHMHTRKLVRKFHDELDQARTDLMRSARVSEDAEVRGEVVRVEQLERFISQLTGKVGDGGMQ